MSQHFSDACAFALLPKIFVDGSRQRDFGRVVQFKFKFKFKL